MAWNLSKVYYPNWVIMNSKLFRCFLLSIFVFSINCQFYDSEEPFDPFYTVDSATFDNIDGYGRTSNSFIKADEYKIGVNLSSQNEYASQFGINPKQQNKIIDLNQFPKNNCNFKQNRI